MTEASLIIARKVILYVGLLVPRCSSLSALEGIC